MLIYLKLTLMAIFWGAAFVGIRHISQFIEPISGASIRFLIATITLALVLKNWTNITHITIKQWLVICLLALAGIVGYNIFFFYSNEKC